MAKRKYVRVKYKPEEEKAKHGIMVYFSEKDYKRFINALNTLEEISGMELNKSYLVRYFVMRGVEEFEKRIGKYEDGSNEDNSHTSL